MAGLEPAIECSVPSNSQSGQHGYAIELGLGQARLAIRLPRGGAIDHGPARQVEPIGLVEQDGRRRERRDHQSVPVGEHLVVETGTDARLAHCEQW